MIQKIQTLQKRLISKTEEVCKLQSVPYHPLNFIPGNSIKYLVKLKWNDKKKLSFNQSSFLPVNKLISHTGPK